METELIVLGFGGISLFNGLNIAMNLLLYGTVFNTIIADSPMRPSIILLSSVQLYVASQAFLLIVISPHFCKPELLCTMYAFKQSNVWLHQDGLHKQTKVKLLSQDKT